MTRSLEASVKASYDALNRMVQGDLAAIEAIWSQQHDISAMGPSGAIQRERGDVMAQLIRESTLVSTMWRSQSTATSSRPATWGAGPASRRGPA